MLRKLSRIAFYAGLVLVVTLSLLPQEALPPTGLWDKANHTAAYGALALAGGLGFPGRRALVPAALGLLLLGAGLELAQAAVPSRTASLYDVLANAIGIVLGSLFATAANTYRPRPRPTDG